MNMYKVKSDCVAKIQKINPRVSNTSNCRTMILSKCVICDSKKLRSKRTIK